MFTCPFVRPSIRDSMEEINYSASIKDRRICLLVIPQKPISQFSYFFLLLGVIVLDITEAIKYECKIMSLLEIRNVKYKNFNNVK